MSLRRTTIALACLAVACAGSGACTSAQGGGPSQSVFVVPASLGDLEGAHFYDHPWPSDLRRNTDGSIHIGGLYDPHQNLVIKAYVDALEGRIAGFSPAAMGYMRFTADIDASTLPASPNETLDPEASVQIVDVDETSPARGSRHLAQVYWRKDDGVYWLASTLAVGPALGYPLRTRTRYAIVVTTRARATDGSAITPSPDLEEVLGTRTTTPHAQAAHDLYAPALAQLEAAGIARAKIAHLAVFTTGDPAAELFAVADDLRAHVAAPTVHDGSWKTKERTADYDVYESVYGPSPIYQSGIPPYRDSGGDFVFDAKGAPQVQGTSDLRVTFVVPNATRCPMPGAGYPMVIYAHGTGGNYRSIVEEGNSVGQALSAKCLASLGFDQLFHGTRPGAPPASDPNLEGDIELLFFNFANPHAMRTNNRQSAIDLVQMARLFTESHTSIPGSIARTGAAIIFDGTKLVFYGHSQGGQNGPLFFAADAQTRGGVLSGASVSVPITLTEKTKPIPSVAASFRTLLGLIHEDEAAELTLAHPILSFAQTFVDPTDPLNYAAYESIRPRAGFAAKSVLLTEGVSPDGTGDSYAPPHGIEVAAIASGLPRMAPGTHAILEASYANVADIAVASGGLTGDLGAGSASGVLAQFLPPSSDGHFVVFDVPAAREMAAQFCRNLADDPHGRVPALR